jgi:large conductance mechanosensitive channel
MSSINDNKIIDKLFGTEVEGFTNFLAENNIVQTGVAFLFSIQTSIIITSLMTDIISPILARILGTDKQKLEDFKLNIFGIHFAIGDFILQFINFILILLIVYQLLKLIPKKILKK